MRKKQTIEREGKNIIYYLFVTGITHYWLALGRSFRWVKEPSQSAMASLWSLTEWKFAR